MATADNFYQAQQTGLVAPEDTIPFTTAKVDDENKMLNYVDASLTDLIDNNNDFVSGNPQ